MIYDNRELFLPRREQAKEGVKKSNGRDRERATMCVPLPVNLKGETLITLINISQEVWRLRGIRRQDVAVTCRGIMPAGNSFRRRFVATRVARGNRRCLPTFYS